VSNIHLIIEKNKENRKKQEKTGKKQKLSRKEAK
jgi:hypothetical protein